MLDRFDEMARDVRNTIDRGNGEMKWDAAVTIAEAIRAVAQERDAEVKAYADELKKPPVAWNDYWVRRAGKSEAEAAKLREDLSFAKAEVNLWTRRTKAREKVVEAAEMFFAAPNEDGWRPSRDAIAGLKNALERYHENN